MSTLKHFLSSWCLLIAAGALAWSGQSIAATTSESATGGFSIDSIAISTRPVAPFPFVGMLDGYQAVAPGLTSWRRDTDFARYQFQVTVSQVIEVGGRLLIRHFQAKSPGSQSLEKVIDSHRVLIEAQGGTQVFAGRFDADAVLKAARSEQQARDGATYLLRTPEREIWLQVSVRENGDEYVLVAVEKGPLIVRTEGPMANALKRSIDTTGKAVIYVNFEYDRAELRPDAKPVLDAVFGLLKTNPSLRLSIEGHTDDLGPAGYNLALSQRRAAAVVAALFSRGIPQGQRSRLVSVGRGAAMPLVPDKTDEGRSKNRRVELIKLN